MELLFLTVTWYDTLKLGPPERLTETVVGSETTVIVTLSLVPVANAPVAQTSGNKAPNALFNTSVPSGDGKAVFMVIFLCAPDDEPGPGARPACL